MGSAASQPRPDIVARMAADLSRMQATASERDAIRALTSRGYRLGDIAALAEDARQKAIVTAKDRH